MGGFSLRMVWLRPLLLFLLLPVAADDGLIGDGQVNLDSAAMSQSEVPRLCVGIRGNGPRLWAHFTSLARIVEEYGPVSASAGGSSGSISVLFTESIHANPLVRMCGSSACTALERRARIALFYKSLQGIQDAGLIDDFVTVAGVIAAIQAGDIETLLQTDPEEAVQALLDIVMDPQLQSIINPELVQLLLTSPDPVFHANDIVESLAAAASFQVNDTTAFVRPGLINFDAFADIVDRLASFYTGYVPFDGAATEQFLDNCAVAGLGLDWPSIKELPAGAQTCGETFSELFNNFRDSRTGDDPSRLDDPIGLYQRALVTTSVLEGQAIPAFETALDSYFAAQPIELEIDFADVRFGYWGRSRDLQRINNRFQTGFPDLKSQKFSSLGQRPWREIITRSPAEPGLSRAVSLPDGRISAGGWSDPVPAQVLRAVGCETTVLVNRRDGIGTFTTDVATQLGASEADLDALFGLGNDTSGFTSALIDADGVWCTDWDAPDTLDVTGLSAQGYNAPLETNNARLMLYPNASTFLDISGCTPLVTD